MYLNKLYHKLNSDKTNMKNLFCSIQKNNNFFKGFSLKKMEWKMEYLVRKKFGRSLEIGSKNTLHKECIFKDLTYKTFNLKNTR